LGADRVAWVSVRRGCLGIVFPLVVALLAGCGGDDPVYRVSPTAGCFRAMGYDVGLDKPPTTIQVGRGERVAFLLYFHKTVAEAKQPKAAFPDLGVNEQRRGNVAVMWGSPISSPTKADWSAVKRCLRS
jgi:hypothetical protein